MTVRRTPETTFCCICDKRLPWEFYTIFGWIYVQDHSPGLIGAQSDGKGRSCARLAGHFDRAAMGLHNGLGNGQAESAASSRARARFVGAIKPLEDMREVFGRDALAGVGDRHDRGAVFAARADAYFTVGFVVVDGVGKEVRDHLAQALSVAAGLSGPEVTVDLDAALLCEGTDAFDACAAVLRQVEVFALDLLLAGVKSGQFEQRLGEAPHLLGGVQAGFD